MKSVYLLTGLPGTGKTTLIKEVVKTLGSKAGGFYTEEVRSGGTREGFRIVTLDGKTALLAHVDIRSEYRVGKYSVDIAGLEKVGVEALKEAARQREVVVIDEIGRMELFSASFKNTVREIIDRGRKVLGTVLLKSDPWADTIKQKPQVQLLVVTRNNHREILEQIKKWLQTG